MLRIVTDSTIDLPGGWREAFDIDVIPISIRIGDRDYLQGVDLEPDEFYRLVRETGKFPQTSLPSIGQFVEFYENIAHPDDVVLSIHLSSKLSGTFSSAVSAANTLAGQYQIIPFDTRSGSAAMAFMCREARQMERAGATMQEILTRLEKIRDSQHILLTLDTLEFAHRSGRINALTAALASVLRMKAIIVLEDGMLEMAERVRTRHRALDRLVQMTHQRAGSHALNVAVVHSCDLDTGRALLDRVCQELICQEALMTELSISVAAHLGPGTVGVAFYPVD
jgi:DegV family protein with EDD domain